jgi:hypothetical protein
MSRLLSYSDTPALDKRKKPVQDEFFIQHHNPLLHVERQARHLQQSLQNFLDAQSEGLLASLSGSDHDDVRSNDSTTPTPSTVSSPRRAPTIPAKQLHKRKIGLGAARRGILRSMNLLLGIKEEERQIITTELEERMGALQEIDTFASKQHGLEKAISDIQDGRDGRRSKSLQEEARNLEKDIHDLEVKLLEMKSRYRQIINEISHVENSVEAWQSSYETSLSLLESEVQRYLQNPPVKKLQFISTESPFYSLNPKRRTLDMAREHWRSEQVELRKRLRGVHREIGALEEGGSVWLSVITEVTNFEKKLKDRMNRFQQTRPLPPDLLDSQVASRNNFEDDHTNAIVQDMDETIRQLEDKLDLAERKDWKLLVCCIGAELEAFKEGKAMLLETLRIKEGGPTIAEEVKDSGSHEEDIAPGASGSEDLAGPSADFLRNTHSPPHLGAARLEDEDDEPDPTWLLSDT